MIKHPKSLRLFRSWEQGRGRNSRNSHASFDPEFLQRVDATLIPGLLLILALLQKRRLVRGVG